MKKLMIAVFFFAAANFASAQAEINWVEMSEVEALMKKEPKKVLVDVYTSWCGPCKMMNKTTFSDPEVVKYINEHYYAIKFDAEGEEAITFQGKEFRNDNFDPAKTRGRNSTHDLTRAIAPVNGRIAYPTIVYMNEEFQILSPVQGFQKPEQIMPILSYFGEDIYQQMEWQEYVKQSK
ncbi:MAG: thioredoxin family protein [Cryomorphaceae bacterium]|nr:DUF255 domain-containing protein [Flavobacteriales bacterium]